MYILGISGTEYEFYHDPSAALLKDGKVIAACEEERFNRIKHSPGKPPEKAIHYCLESAHLTLKDIDCIAYNVNLEDRITEEKSKEQIDKVLSIIPLQFRHHYRIPPIFRVSHHITHIASAFYQSGFKDAACLIVDGQGEYESVTLATARGNIIKEIKKYGIIDSIGFLYDAASYYCGFSFNSAGKLMGLAPYGRPCQKIPLSFDVKKEKFIHSLFRTPKEIPNKLPLAFDLMQAYLEHFKRYNYPYKRGQIIDIMTYIDFAASVQKNMEDIMAGLVTVLRSKTKSENLVINGGCALNCTANGIIDRLGLFKNIFIHPGANDAGSSIGAALEIFRFSGCFDTNLPDRISSVFYGPGYSDDKIAEELKNAGFSSSYIPDDELLPFTAQSLQDHKIVGWFQHRSEFGPRALGARSILGNPSKRENLVNINLLKGREMFRPLAPSILDKLYTDIFDDPHPHNLTEYMLKTVNVRPEWKTRIPAVVHIDGTSRPQVVKEKTLKKYFTLISEFYKLSGIPLIINTSFNTAGKPLVNTPAQAIEVFKNNKLMDVLVIGNRYITRD